QLGELDERQRTALETVFTSARKLSRLIDDILDLSRLEAGQMDFELKPVRMDELLSELNDLVSVLADQSKISLELDIENGLPPVSGDREQLLRVIMNLVSNALKFTPENGRIRVGLRRDSAATLRVSVMDTGMGIPKDKLEKIFDKFFQVSETKDSSRRKGSGLGLSICRKIIQAHNGRIWAESDLGHGSTFHFTLPLSPEPEGRKTADLSTA
ncbi:MAG: sensor histidine kinase, partial [Elusimicrobia bacterium]|nr:sensor histidine kinase [Elusimicrobiota bacterium]